MLHDSRNSTIRKSVIYLVTTLVTYLHNYSFYRSVGGFRGRFRHGGCLAGSRSLPLLHASSRAIVQRAIPRRHANGVSTGRLHGLHIQHGHLRALGIDFVPQRLVQAELEGLSGPQSVA